MLPLQRRHFCRKPWHDGANLKRVRFNFGGLPMLCDSGFVRSHQLVLRQFSGEVVHRLVRLDEFCALLLSRRPLERCNDDASHCRGLFDPRTGELFDIRESDLFSPR